jgi:hypothetical protein
VGGARLGIAAQANPPSIGETRHRVRSPASPAFRAGPVAARRSASILREARPHCLLPRCSLVKGPRCTLSTKASVRRDTVAPPLYRDWRHLT